MPKNRDQIEGLSFVNVLSSKLKAIAEFEVNADDFGSHPIRLLLNLFYDTEFVGTLSFSLHNYSVQECLDLARNVADDAYLLSQIDDYLSGDNGE